MADFADQLKPFATRAAELREHLQTEEATKTALVLPFLQLLGYDIFNPREVVPEFTADVGIKKGEKVDYAIMKDGLPIVLVECKSCTENLDNHSSQLFRYFATTNAKFGLLTNGLVYKFFTDLDDKNKMDEQPFLEFDLINMKKNQVNELVKFQKSTFDVDTIVNTASELRYSSQIQSFFAQLLKEPNDEFLNMMISSCYQGKKIQSVIDKFRPIVKRAINQYISDMMSDKITTALKTDAEAAEKEKTEVVAEIEPANDSKIVTTEDELEAYYIVKSILAEAVSPKRIHIKDTVNYCGILLDNKTTKWVCRYKLTDKKKYFVFPSSDKEERIEISQLEDIYQFRSRLIEILNSML